MEPLVGDLPILHADTKTTFRVIVIEHICELNLQVSNSKRRRREETTITSPTVAATPPTHPQILHLHSLS